MRTGRSDIRIQPLIRLLMMFWAPKPMPMATAPLMNASAVTGMSSMPRAVMNSTTSTL